MTAFLFWNLNRKNLQSSVVDVVATHAIDVLMLVESGISPKPFLDEVNSARRGDWYYALSICCERVEVFTRFPAEFASAVHEKERFTIRHLRPPGRTDILLAIVHLSSKRYWDEASQGFECVPLSDAIKDTEQRIGHSRTVLVGDFNMSPFENGMVSAAGLHGVMTRQIACKGFRKVQSREYPFFYNPMWNLMGDEPPGPPGTHYYAETGHRAFFWHMFDQVLVRPDLLDRFDTRNLRVLEWVDHTPLLDAVGLPDKELASDHLPLLFQVAL
jgi:hypothetical protein